MPRPILGHDDLTRQFTPVDEYVVRAFGTGRATPEILSIPDGKVLRTGLAQPLVVGDPCGLAESRLAVRAMDSQSGNTRVGRLGTVVRPPGAGQRRRTKAILPCAHAAFGAAVGDAGHARESLTTTQLPAEAN